jgi:hypothetical protein
LSGKEELRKARLPKGTNRIKANSTIHNKSHTFWSAWWARHCSVYFVCLKPSMFPRATVIIGICRYNPILQTRTFTLWKKVIPKDTQNVSGWAEIPSQSTKPTE